MQIITTLDELNQAVLPPSAAALGTFDGLHRGHQKVIHTTRAYAKEHGLSSLVFTFSNHPLAFLKPEKEPPRLLSNPDKIALLEEMGIDILCNIPFTRELADLSADRFLTLLEDKGVRAVGIGTNFSFGAGGTGNVDFLNKVHEKYELTILTSPLLTLDGCVISSTQIRRAIGEGQIHKANFMLGRPYVIHGTVVHGDKRGRTLGFPTANISLMNAKIAIPQYGVYAGLVKAKGAWYKAMLNVGNNPTFDTEDIRLEAHLFGFDRNLYGETITVKLMEKIRDEIRFSSAEQLIRQMEKDKKATLLMDFSCGGF